MNSRSNNVWITNDALNDAIDALSEGFAVYSPELKLVTCNIAYREMLAPIADVIRPGAAWEDIVRAGALAGIFSNIDHRIEEFIDATRERMFRTGGSVDYWESDGRYYRSTATRTPEGRFVVMRADITEQRRAEDMARDREALLTTILDTNPIPVVMARLSDARILYQSPEAREMFGETETVMSYYVDEEDRDGYIAALQEHGRVDDYRLRAVRKDGKILKVALSGGLTTYNGETFIVSSATDLTEHLEREALIRRVVESCPSPVMMNRAESGDILFKSPGISALYGEGENASDFYVDPADRRAFLAALRRTGEVTEHRSLYKNAAGDPVWVAVSARLITWDGEEVIVSSARDLTQQLAIEAELSRQREQVFQNEKMSALGSLLAGVAHELNNPLSVVVGHAMMLEDEVTDEDVLRQMRKISDAAERCAKIVKTFLTMARQEPQRREETDINEVVSTAVEVARFGDATRAVRIETELSDEIGPICGDADQLTQVVINLILNAEQAIDAAGQGDRIRIATAPGDAEGEVRITVEDNGPGIRPEIRARVFEPFFTTKGVGQGTGIGLAMCHRIVSVHNGTITLEDVRPTGARFIVTVPCNKPSPRQDCAPAAEAVTPSVYRVLVVDDEADVADLNAEVLLRGGYETEVAHSAEEALECLRERPFHAVISDLNMHGLGGRGFYEAISDEFANLLPHTGFITGDTMGRTSQSFLQEADRPYLEKPVSPRELRAFVAELCVGSAT